MHQHHFPTYYVYTIRCPPDAKFNKDPNQTVSNKLVRLKETRYASPFFIGVMTPIKKGLASHHAAILDKYD